ncbi:tyrosine-type recombinase/integrase [Pantoea ananatis]|uniref:tyrosine-type recombinase/integrase n=2 Tax=Pantoea ananas TaxID=553 RepID=UPI00049660D7|nr:site-specific integrase [Pantoea ananatis]
MATFRQLPSGKWNAQVRIKGYPTKTATRSTREEVEQWALQFENELKKEMPCLSHFISDYLEEVMMKDGKRRGGYEATSYRLNTLVRMLNGKPLESLTSEDIAAYKLQRSKQVSGSTVRLELQLLSRVLRWANSEKGVVCSDVVKPVKLPNAGKPRSKIVEEHEYKMILERVSEKAKAIIMLAWETAMRRNELLAITPSMVDFKKRVIHLSDEQTKNGEGRDVPLSSNALTLLRELCGGRQANSRLFILTPYAVTQAFRRAARESHVYGVCFHSLRHTAITRYAEKGLNTIQLQCISGHKSISMLARYSHIKASSVADLMG